MIPFWVVPAIILIYFGKKVMNQVYDLKLIICHVCGRNIFSDREISECIIDSTMRRLR